MSGGKWDYVQFKFDDVIETIRYELRVAGKIRDKDELYSWKDEDWYDRYPEDRYHRDYPKKVKDEFRKVIEYLTIARIYTQRVDWLLSGDDGEDSFLRRIKEDLAEEGLL